ncbi:MAG TPA: DUF4345 domain-containing protein [Azospirillaceae bacterium]|nr:DUF4345 domain-containing protein [Azospirillaceae bacterium]
MPDWLERRALQAAVAVACLVPLSAGLAGVLEGPGMIPGMEGWPADMGSHFRYLSGLLLGLGLVFLSAVPDIGRRTARFQAAGAVVVTGGLARAGAALSEGLPGWPHAAALVMELGVVPALMLWQRRVARRAA